MPIGPITFSRKPTKTCCGYVKQLTSPVSTACWIGQHFQAAFLSGRSLTVGVSHGYLGWATTWEIVKVVQVILVFVVQECEIHHEKLWSDQDSLKIQYFL